MDITIFDKETGKISKILHGSGDLSVCVCVDEDYIEGIYDPDGYIIDGVFKINENKKKLNQRKQRKGGYPDIWGFIDAQYKITSNDEDIKKSGEQALQEFYERYGKALKNS